MSLTAVEMCEHALHVTRQKLPYKFEQRGQDRDQRWFVVNSDCYLQITHSADLRMYLTILQSTVTTTQNLPSMHGRQLELAENTEFH